jgi:putative membrane protein
MAFVDILTSQLFATGILGLIIVITTLRAYLLYKNGKKHYRSLRGAAIPLGVIGFYIILSGLYGQFFWPLPGSYNILFYDIFTLSGLMFVAFAWALHSDIDTQPVGFFGLMVGLIAIYYGYEGYILGLTSAPLALFGLYSLYGLAGILSYPMTVLLDRADLGMKIKWVGWYVLAAGFLIFLALGSILAIYIAASAIPVHLASPP